MAVADYEGHASASLLSVFADQPTAHSALVHILRSQVAFLWELLSLGFNILISDLDVVWLNGHWARWMTWDVPNVTVPEAQLIALADVLVTTDELNAERDANGGRPNHMSDLNTGVVYFRNTKGALAMVQQWRKSMLAQKGRKDLNENVNDQSLFNRVSRA